MSIPVLSLKDQVAIVTGAKRGIGKAIAVAFAEAGADVAICTRVVEDGKLEAVAEEIRQLGGRCLAIQADISQKTDVDNMVQRVMDEFDSIDILVNNAGEMVWGQPLLECCEDDWDRVMDIDLKGYYLCSQAAGKRMMERKRGNIISLSSVAGPINVVPGSGTYCIAKAGVVTLTRVLALELGSYNIRVNAIAPCWVKTEMNLEVRSAPRAEEQIANGIPLGRLGETDDIAKTALFLASDVSSYITGQTIVVDGGVTETTFAH